MENSHINVLIVDDQIPASRSITLMLRHKNIITTSFDTPACGKVVMEWLDTRPAIDFAILDILINGISGIDIANKIKKIYPTCPILFMTGCSTSSDKYKEAVAFASVNKYCHFYHKPVDPIIGKALRCFVIEKLEERDKDVEQNKTNNKTDFGC